MGQIEDDYITHMAFAYKNGSLPPKMTLSPEDLSAKIGTYTSADLESFNQEVSEDMLAECEFPFHVLGFTSDHKIAYFGVNYVGTKSVDELRTCLDLLINEGAEDKDRIIALTAKRELEMLLARSN